MIDWRKYDYFVFDCDGVILDSNKIKSDAFAQALEGEDSNLVTKFVQYHKENGGISRYVKFEYYYQELSPHIYTQTAVSEALQRYSVICREQLAKCPEINGVTAALRLLQTLNKKCFVNSGGDQNELREIFSLRDLSPYFESIFGSPNTKSDNMTIIVNAMDGSRSALLFGDSATDLKAATDFGLDFVFVAAKSEWKDGLQYCRDNTKMTVSDFTQLL
jgi:phosphoglycolate phosphatase-like HAD superfamily hydrolase